ncbi:hypothetical protein I4U23_027122 [Adineta vaga]|nr:hypothetical protein I4U23_027122 [Adineta vaga]
MFITMFHHTKSKYNNILRTITNSTKKNIELELKKLNERKEFVKALALFDKHEHQTIPTDAAICQALKACTQLGYIERGQIIHKNLSKNALNNTYIQPLLIQFYMQCGRVNDAQHVFDSSKNKTMVHYTSMMKGFIKNNMSEKAIELFKKVTDPDEILLCLLFNSCAQVRTKEALDFGRKIWSQMPLIYYKNQYILNTTLDMFIKCDDIINAEKLFNKKKRIVIDYGQMMKCYNNHHMPMNTLNLYERMTNENIQANIIIFVLLIDACAQLGIESRCRSIVKQIPSSMLNNLQLQSALIHMWGKVGCVNEAKQIFEKIHQRDPVVYASMINSYGLNGMGHNAIELYYQMPREMLHDKAYTCVLNACSHSGLVDEARSIFSTIPNKTKYIYTTMIDCLSRSFFFDEAKQLIQEFERDQLPDLHMYMSLLSGVRNRNDALLAREITNQIRERFQNVDEHLLPASILLTNTLASSGELQEASQIRWKLNQSGAKKQVGLSWTEVNGEIVQFRVQDRSHPRTREIYEELHRIENELIEHGHKFDSSWITRPMMADESVESILNSHSERLALAFNFIQRPIPSRIQIVKNLRICGDCHAAIKLISQIRQCQIIIRDANRIHDFSNGKCSYFPMETITNNDQSIWLKVKSPSIIEHSVPKLIDLQLTERFSYSNKLRLKSCLYCLLCLLCLLLILLSILLPILLIKNKSIPVTNNSTMTTTTRINCIYPNMFNEVSNNCVNILIDSNNCGQINNKCAFNYSCSNGICADAPGIQLKNSNIIFSSATNGSADDQMFKVTIPWNITIYNKTTNSINVTTDGILCFGNCSTSYTETLLPSNIFSNVTIFPYWDDLYIYSNTSQGIYYQSDGKSPNQILTFEYYMSHYLQPKEYYHFQVIFFENFPNIFQVKYYEATDGGITCTIGVQASDLGPFILYSFDQANSVETNMLLTFDTNIGIFNKTTF